MINVKFVSNLKFIDQAFAKQFEDGLIAIGEKAERYAKSDTPVDTGRLRASITYATIHTHSAAGAEAEAGDSDERRTPSRDSVVIGTNVHYAPKIEFVDMSHTVGHAHFLKNAISTHNDEYKKAMEAALKN